MPVTSETITETPEEIVSAPLSKEDAEELVKAFDRSRVRGAGSSEIKTPVKEGGIRLDPTRSPRSVSNNAIQRVWAQSFGYSGRDLRRLRVDDYGSLSVFDYPWHQSRSTVETFTISSGSDTIDLGELVDWVEVWCHEDVAVATFSQDNVTFSHSRIVVPLAAHTSGAAVYGVLQIRIRTRYVKLTRTNIGTASMKGHVVGEILAQ
tara:strand:- start:5572 stop:6189 length:618 start_codon:yes stop_codon:yes gene_type:complete